MVKTGGAHRGEGEKTWNEKFREWYEDKKGKGDINSISELSEYMGGVPESSLKDYLSSRVTNLDRMSEERRILLYQKTGIGDFIMDIPESALRNKLTTPEIEESVAEVEGVAPITPLAPLLGMVRELERYLKEFGVDNRAPSVLKSKMEAHYGNMPEYVAGLFYLLVKELEYFKDSTPEERKLLREIIPQGDIGYFESLLHAIYEEQDDYKKWIFEVSREIQGPEKSKRLKNEWKKLKEA